MGSKLTDKQKRMKEAVEYLQDYMNTYDKQSGYLDYDDQTFIDDLLYHIGVALDPEKYRSGPGYKEFKKRLREHLNQDDKQPAFYIESIREIVTGRYPEREESDYIWARLLDRRSSLPNHPISLKWNYATLTTLVQKYIRTNMLTEYNGNRSFLTIGICMTIMIRDDCIDIFLSHDSIIGSRFLARIKNANEETIQEIISST